jgi:hypothetical protein
MMLLCAFLSVACSALAQRGVESKPGQDRRRVSKREVKFYGEKFDSIKSHLNRMIRFEKQLRQRNYYLNEKTALIDELLHILETMEASTEVVEYRDEDVKRIFGRKRLESPGVYIYQVETYKSNCPFLEITIHHTRGSVNQIAHRITDCERIR